MSADTTGRTLMIFFKLYKTYTIYLDNNYTRNVSYWYPERNENV